MGGVTRCCCCAVVLLVHHVLRLKILSELRRGRIAHSTVKFDLGRIRILLLQVVLVNVMSSTAAQNFLLSFPLIIKVIFERTMTVKGLEIVGHLAKEVRHRISGLGLLVVGGGRRGSPRHRHASGRLLNKSSLKRDSSRNEGEKKKDHLLHGRLFHSKIVQQYLYGRFHRVRRRQEGSASFFSLMGSFLAE